MLKACGADPTWEVAGSGNAMLKYAHTPLDGDGSSPVLCAGGRLPSRPWPHLRTHDAMEWYPPFTSGYRRGPAQKIEEQPAAWSVVPAEDRRDTGKPFGPKPTPVAELSLAQRL